MSEKTPEELLDIILPKTVSVPKPLKRKWSEEQRQKARERMYRVRPWEKTTGAKTPEGKKRCSQNAYKHGRYSKAMKEIEKLVYELKRESGVKES